MDRSPAATRVAIALGEPHQAKRNAHHALTCAADLRAHLLIPDILECLAGLALEDGSHHEAARLFGAAEAIRQSIGVVGFQIDQAGHQASVAALRNAMGQQNFESAWTEGATLFTEEAIGYASRPSGKSMSPTSWRDPVVQAA